MKKNAIRILCPSRHLGFAPIREGSFWLGAETRPDYYCCNSGGYESDPLPLGSDGSTSLYDWQKSDLELLLLASRKQGVPMIIGSAGDSGANSRVDLYVKIIQHLVHVHNLAPVKIAYFYSEIEKDVVRQQIEQGIAIQKHASRNTISEEQIRQTDRIVAVAGSRPFLRALEMGADVIIGGRSDGPALFAAAVLHHGFPASHAHILGEVMQHGSLCAEPFMAHETIIGTATHDCVSVTALHPQQACTLASVQSCLQEKGRRVPTQNGLTRQAELSSACTYEQTSAHTVTIRTCPGALGEEALPLLIEGAGKVGECFWGFVEIESPSFLDHLEHILAWAQTRIEERFTGKQYRLRFQAYNTRPDDVHAAPPRHVSLLIETIAETEQIAEEITAFTTHLLRNAPFHGRQRDAGCMLTSMIFPVPPVYQWTIRHHLEIDDPQKFFDVHELLIS